MINREIYKPYGQVLFRKLDENRSSSKCDEDGNNNGENDRCRTAEHAPPLKFMKFHDILQFRSSSFKTVYFSPVPLICMPTRNTPDLTILPMLLGARAELENNEEEREIGRNDVKLGTIFTDSGVLYGNGDSMLRNQLFGLVHREI
ncbi:hypothetical protein ANTQUA_LOCUS10251 [Anthophora quadrimaculata]